MDISGLRREYERGSLERDDLADDPLEQFERWFEEARANGLPEPNAMSVATAAADGQPSLRTVLMKYFDRQGLVFFTNLESCKADEIKTNPRVALLFYWLPLERQVAIRGTAERISRRETLSYFMKRPRGSQLGAWVSDQSRVLTSRKLLELKLDEMRRRYADGKIPLPSWWGGYRVRPHAVEFWQGRRNRLHDRFLYTLDGAAWRIERLAP